MSSRLVMLVIFRDYYHLALGSLGSLAFMFVVLPERFSRRALHHHQYTVTAFSEMPLTVMWVTAHDSMDYNILYVTRAGTYVACTIQLLQTDGSNVCSFSEARLSDTKAALHSDNPSMWGNVSALIIRLFWERWGGGWNETWEGHLSSLV